MIEVFVCLIFLEKIMIRILEVVFWLLRKLLRKIVEMMIVMFEYVIVDVVVI